MEPRIVFVVALISVVGLIALSLALARFAKIKAALGRFSDAGRQSACVKTPDARDVFAEVCRQYALTEREQDVARLIIQGRSNQQIADDLCVTVSTIKKHITKVYHKCGVASRDELLTLCVSHSKSASPLSKSASPLSKSAPPLSKSAPPLSKSAPSL